MDLKTEDALYTAINTIEFLHSCLTQPDLFEYAYPEHTTGTLETLRALVSERESCIHSRTIEGCRSCEEHLARAIRRQKETT